MMFGRLFTRQRGPGERIVAIVPAYNEGRHLGRVLAPLREMEDARVLERLIVVDDGSADGTADVARRHGAHLVRHLDGDGRPENRGKLRAFASGLEAAQAYAHDIVLAADADYSDLTARKLSRLIGSISRAPDVCMAVGNCMQGEYESRGASSRSGLRAVRRDVVSPLLPARPAEYAWVGEALEVLTGYKGYALEAVIERLAKDRARGRKIEREDVAIHSRAAGGAYGIWQVTWGAEIGECATRGPVVDVGLMRTLAACYDRMDALPSPARER